MLKVSRFSPVFPAFLLNQPVKRTTRMDAQVKRINGAAADVKISRHKRLLSVQDFLNQSGDLPDQMVYLTNILKTGTPICTAILSLDLKTIHYSSTDLFEIRPDKDFRMDQTVHLFPFEIIQAEMCFDSDSSLNVQILSIPIRTNLRFCIIYKDGVEKNEKTDHTEVPRFKTDFMLTFEKLTSREKQVARLVALGKTSSQLARELYIAKDTVKIHRKNIRRKLNITSRAEQMAINEWLRNISSK